MNPLVLLALLGGGFLLYKSLSTVDALKTLQVEIIKFQVYNVSLGNGISIRITVRFANLSNEDINIDRIYVNGYWGTGKCCTLDASNITIPANSTTEQQFLVSVTWLEAAAVLNNFAQYWMNNKPLPDVRLVGIVKAMGQTIEFENTIPTTRP